MTTDKCVSRIYVRNTINKGVGWNQLIYVVVIQSSDIVLVLILGHTEILRHSHISNMTVFLFLLVIFGSEKDGGLNPSLFANLTFTRGRNAQKVCP